MTSQPTQTGNPVEQTVVGSYGQLIPVKDIEAAARMEVHYQQYVAQHYNQGEPSGS